MSTALEHRIKLLEHQMQTALTAVSNDNASIMRLLEQTMQAIGVLNSRVVALEKELYGSLDADTDKEGAPETETPGTEP